MLLSNKSILSAVVYLFIALFIMFGFAQTPSHLFAAALEQEDTPRGTPVSANQSTPTSNPTSRETATAGRSGRAITAACSVPSATYPTIASALSAVGCNPINVAAGTYTENLTVNRSVTIIGAGKGSTFIDGGGVGRVFSISFDALNFVLSDVTVQNGNGAGGSGQGGGLENWTATGTIHIRNSEFRNNSAGFGGAIMHGGGASTIVNTTFTSNSSVTSGGAVYNGGTLSMTNAEFLSSSSASGGAIYNENTNGSGVLNIMATLFQGSTASEFGGAIENRATLNVAHSTIYNNTGTRGGGGIYNGFGATADIYNSTIFGNTGAQGGGLNNERATLNVYHSTITNNTGNDGTGSLGDGIINITFDDGVNSIVNLDHVTLASNNDTGILQADASTNGAGTFQVNLSDTIVAGHTTADCRKYFNKASEVYSAAGGYNLDQDGTCIVGGGTGNSTANPLLGTLQDNGGHTWTMAPGPTSPVLNAIPSGTNGCGTTELVDQRGVLLPQGSHCEIGAYEQESNTAPTAVDDSYNGIVDQPLTIAASGVLSNDLDSEGDALIVIADTDSAGGGTIDMNPDGGFTYNPPLAQSGSDTFDYTVMDTVGMVAYWPFAEGAGTTAVDFTNNSNNGALTNGPTYDNDTPTLNILNRYSLNFDGIDDSVIIPDSADLDLNTFSIGGWFKPHTADTNWQPLITKEADNGFDRSFGVFIHPNTMQLHVSFFTGDCSATNYTINSIKELTLNSWNHVMISYDGHMLALYIDGALDNSALVNATVCNNSQPVRLGGGESVFSYFDGQMDDIRIYRQPFSASEALQSANGNNGLTDSGQVTINLPLNCFAETTGDNITDFATSDGSAVQAAVDSVSSGLIRLAGTCTGVQYRGLLTQTVYIAKDLHLQGGYDHTDWSVTPDPVTHPTVLDADGGGRVAYIGLSNKVTFENLTLQNGVANGIDGAGIYNRATFTLTNSIVQNNSQTGGTGGGGIFSQAPNTQIISSTIQHNSTAGSGGGVLLSSGIGLIDNSHIFSNTATFGGGINARFQTLFVTVDSMVEENNASALGGGLFLLRTPAQVAYSTLLGNRASYGAAINNQEGQVSIQNSTVTKNVGAESLANIRADDFYLTELNLTNTTVVSNTGDGLNNNDTTAQWPTVTPVGYWSFDDESNPTADNSGHGHTGTLYNNPTFSTDLPTSIGSGRSLHFPSSDDYVGVLDDPALRISNRFTLAFWMKADTMAQSQTYLIHRSLNQVAVIYEYVDNHVELFSGSATGDDPRTGSQMAIPDTDWHHVAYTYDGTTLRGYIDGTEQISVTKSFTLSTNTGDWNFGSAAGATGNFDGKLDDIYIYDQVLTADNIQAIMKGIAEAERTKITLKSSVIAHHTNDCNNLSGRIDVSNGYNLDSDGSCLAGGVGTGNVTADPLLSTMQVDTSLNQAYYTPLPFSPLIDAIPTSVNNCGSIFFQEQLNRTRPVDNRCDIGSIELQTNYLPTAVADVYTTTENIALTISATGLLTNDSDGDGDSLSANLSMMPSHGTVNLSADGSFVYTPTTSYVGTDSFTYLANDGQGNSAATTVTIHLLAAAETPQVTLTIPLPNVLVSWNGSAANCSYNVYRSDSPYTGYGVIASGITMSPVVDANAGNGMSNYFYYVEAINCVGNSMAQSSQTGLFNFALTPGN